MSKKLFVGGLSWNVTKEILKEAFSAHGTVVSTVVVLDKETQKSRGFGFVDFATETEAQAAQQAMNETALDGRTIHVRPAIENKPDNNKPKRPMTPRSNTERTFQPRTEPREGRAPQKDVRPPRDIRPSLHNEERPAPRRNFSKDPSNSEEQDFIGGSDWGGESMGDQWGGDEQWEKDNRRKRREGKKKKKQYKKHDQWDDWED